MIKKFNVRTTQKRDTTAKWNAKVDFIPLEGEIIIYTDYAYENGQYIPNMKIGDGKAYLIDLPFICSPENVETIAHINNASIHVSSTDRDTWDSKISCEVDGENLIFTT